MVLDTTNDAMHYFLEQLALFWTVWIGIPQSLRVRIPRVMRRRFGEMKGFVGVGMAQKDADTLSVTAKRHFHILHYHKGTTANQCYRILKQTVGCAVFRPTSLVVKCLER